MGVSPFFYFVVRGKNVTFAQYNLTIRKMKAYNGKLFLAVMLALVMGSCSRKKDTDTIITKIELPKVSKETKAACTGDNSQTFQWGSGNCEARVSVTADKGQPVVKDEDGNKYYDNVVTLVLDSPDGLSVKREFRKGDFTPYINTDYIKPSKSIIKGLVFNKVENGNAVFVATIGSPDDMADEYMLVEVNVSKSGAVTMSGLQEME